jgi:outer membrane protein assembly factor BamB
VGALLLLVTLTGCGADDAGAPERPPKPSGPQHLEITQTYPLAGGPEWLLEAFGTIWLHEDNGNVLGFDPTSGKQVTTLDSGYHGAPPCQGLGADESGLWSCSGTGLVGLDPETGATTPVVGAKRTDEGRFALSGGLLWYLESGSNDLVGLDESGTETARVTLGELCTELAYDDDLVFALCPTGNHVLRVDPGTRTVSGTLDVTNPRAGAVGKDLFVGTGSGMVQVDTATLEVLHTYDDVGPGLFGAVDATADEVWVREQDGTFLTEIDPETHEVVATVEAPQLLSGGDVLITDDWIWATSSDDDTVVRVAR